MKIIILFTMPLTLSAASFSQQTNTLPGLTKQDFLKKSRSQNTSAWFLLCGGVVMAGISGGIAANKAATDFPNIFSRQEQKQTNTVEILSYTSLAWMLGSIPLFIAARKNIKKSDEPVI